METVLGSISRAWLSFKDSHALCLSKIKCSFFRSFIWYIKHFVILNRFWENCKNLSKIDLKKHDRADIKWLQCMCQDSITHWYEPAHSKKDGSNLIRMCSIRKKTEQFCQRTPCNFVLCRHGANPCAVTMTFFYGLKYNFQYFFSENWIHTSFSCQ